MGRPIIVRRRTLWSPLHCLIALAGFGRQPPLPGYHRGRPLRNKGLRYPAGSADR